jgi:hypothetical protein
MWLTDQPGCIVSCFWAPSTSLYPRAALLQLAHQLCLVGSGATQGQPS